MPTKTDLERKSLERLILYILDTAPHEYGLVPGDGGWVPVKDLVASIRGEEGFRGVTEGRVTELARLPGHAQPFETEGGLFRVKPAFQKGPPPLPPDLALPRELWCGVRPAGWRSASENGLRPRAPKETRLALFADKALAMKVAGRFCPDPVPVKVMAARARDAGVVFQPFAETLWLADWVPAGFLAGPPVKPLEGKEPSRPAGKAAKPGKAVPETPMEVLGFPLPGAGPLPSRGKKKGRFGDSPDWKTQTRRDRRGGNGGRG
jgi:RNA:NAD 2'-phosphotransferase (TPT1/KptA family)